MPNISAKLAYAASDAQVYDVDGACYHISWTGAFGGGDGTVRDVDTGFDASRSNAEYGAQPTVMPASADMVISLYLGRPAEV